MKTYFYYNTEIKRDANQDEKIEAYMAHNGITDFKKIQDSSRSTAHWSERPIAGLLNEVQEGDQLVIYDAATMSCSTGQALDIIGQCVQKRIGMHFIKFGIYLSNVEPVINTVYLLGLISRIESDYISRRTARALAKRKAAGLPLGRPKGRTNKSLKLDQHREKIMEYLALRVSKASIAKLLKCHPQTLYDWLTRNNIDADNPTTIED